MVGKQWAYVSTYAMPVQNHAHANKSKYIST